MHFPRNKFWFFVGKFFVFFDLFLVFLDLLLLSFNLVFVGQLGVNVIKLFFPSLTGKQKS